MELFTLVAKIAMDSSEYERGIKKASGAFDTLSKGISAKTIAMGNMIAHAMEKAVNVAAVLGRSAIQNAADVTAEKAQFTATFAELQGSAEKTFKEIEKSTGVFGTRLKNVGTKAFSQFKGAGLDGVDALDMMKDYTNLAADAAAYYDISLEDADARLRSFLRGNTEAGDAIGLFTSESQRNSAAMEKYGQKWQALTEAQKQILMLDISKDIYKQSGAIGQAARESDQWTNVIGNLKEVWRQASGVFGAPIVAAITPAIKSVGDWLNEPDVQLKIEQFGRGVADAINWILDPKIPTWEEVKEGAQTALDAINAGLNSAINWAVGLGADENALQIVKDILSVFANIGKGVFSSAESMFGKMISLFGMDTDGLSQASTFFNDIKTLSESEGFQGIVGILTDVVLAATAMHHPLLLLAAVIAEIAMNWEDVKEWAGRAHEAVKTFFTETVPDALSPILNRISGKLSGIAEWANKAAQTVSNLLGMGELNTDVETNPNNPYGSNYHGKGSTSGFGGGKSTGTGGTGGSFATGLDYVPYNNFAARLHEGEAVLTKTEATDWRRGGSGQSGSNADLLAELRALRQELAASRKVFTPDGRVLGDMVTEPVSQNIAAGSRSRRYSFG